MDNHQKHRSTDWTILKLLQWANDYFRTRDIENPRASAEILLAHALKLKRIDLYLRWDQPLNPHELEKFKTLIKRRIQREPVAYILGFKEFWSIEIGLTKDVLIPRPETECLVEAALALLPKESTTAPKRILDLGTGSGAIVLALASQQPKHYFFASDCSIKALAVARQNTNRHKLDGVIHFLAGDWFRTINSGIPLFDLIISNPPYIRSGDFTGLQPEIHRYEPRIALDGGSDGLHSLKEIISSAHGYLNRHGHLLLEIGHDQKEAVQMTIDNCGRYNHIVYSKDYSGLDRVVQMKKKDI
jgi:release factor glutamine methyltransferase